MNLPQTFPTIGWNYNTDNTSLATQEIPNRIIYDEDISEQETQQQSIIRDTEERDINTDDRYTSIDTEIENHSASIVNTVSYKTAYEKVLKQSMYDITNREREDIVAVIALLMDNNKYKCITLYNKGYVSWCGIILYKYYYSYSKVSKLVSLGSLEYLDSKIDMCVPMITKGDMNDSINSITNHAPIIYNDLISIRRIQASYYYIFSNNCWKIGIIGNRHYSYLDDALVYADVIPITHREKHQLQQKIFDYELI